MKKAVIIGGGRSGQAAEKLAVKLGFTVEIVTDETCKQLPECDLIIASPGFFPANLNFTVRASRPAESLSVNWSSPRAIGSCPYSP